MSTRLCLSKWWIWHFLCFCVDAFTEFGAFMRTEFLCFSVLRVTSGPGVKLADRKSALSAPPPPPPPPPQTPAPVVYSTDPSKAVAPVLVLLFVALWFILRGDLFYVLPCVLVFFSPFSIAITSLGEERASLGAFRTFVWFAIVWFCLFPLPLGVWKGLRFVIVTLPGLISYLFFSHSWRRLSPPQQNKRAGNQEAVLSVLFPYSEKKKNKAKWTRSDFCHLLSSFPRV